MATSFRATASASAASAARNATDLSTYLPLCHRQFRPLKLSFRIPHKIHLPLISKGVQSNPNYAPIAKAQSNEVAVHGSSNAASDSSVSPVKAKAKSTNELSTPLASEESISEFISQVSSLLKLVDSKDIVELQLKQFDCEILIRKKEALPQTPAPAPVPVVPSNPVSVVQPSSPPAPAASPPPGPGPGPGPGPVSSQTPAKQKNSSLPAIKCPMAGTFYRSPGPGEPPFVKVGDKVQKGQVLCIVEAMKLMNDIEADQSGTIVEVLAEDGKPVSVDMPLFLIQP